MDTVDRIFNLVDAKYKEQKDFAAVIGVPPQRVSEWRNRKLLSYQKILPQIAEALDTSVDYLVNGTNEIIKVEYSSPLHESLDKLLTFAEGLVPWIARQIRIHLKGDPTAEDRLQKMPCSMLISVSIIGCAESDFQPASSPSNLLNVEGFAPKQDLQMEKLFHLCKQLNKEGTEKLLNYADDMVSTGKYKNRNIGPL